MGKHRNKEERLEEKFRQMREQQLLKRQMERSLKKPLAKRQPVPAPETSAPKPVVPEVPEFTWGLPSPRRTKAQMRSTWMWHRRKKAGVTSTAPKCSCGECDDCRNRASRAEYMKKWRADKQAVAQE